MKRNSGGLPKFGFRPYLFGGFVTRGAIAFDLFAFLDEKFA